MKIDFEQMALENEETTFVFYGSWRELLEGFDKETAKEILWQIMLLGTTGEIDTNNVMIQQIIKGCVAPSIHNTKTRYQKSKVDGAKGGRPKKEFDIFKASALKEQGYSNAAIAEELGVSKETVRTRLNEYNNNSAKNLAENWQETKNRPTTNENLEENRIEENIKEYKVNSEVPSVEETSFDYPQIWGGGYFYDWDTKYWSNPSTVNLIMSYPEENAAAIAKAEELGLL
jgi:predicted transcriptional regulator